jgi:hypothetical protein
MLPSDKEALKNILQELDYAHFDDWGQGTQPWNVLFDPVLGQQDPCVDYRSVCSLSNFIWLFLF